MGRREQREQIFKLVFMVEFNAAEEIPEQIANYFENSQDATEDEVLKPASEKDIKYISEKFELIREKIPEIDSMINEQTSGWTTDRLGKVELAIIRLAIYEMKYDDAVPVSVAINEAVELAKKFGQDEAPSFVNGVLAKFSKE
ncbi:MAG: transcription antitermination factor NusB [Lachnospiraceae bacterium]|nr:transcription antitermination factor NusB [Lachnospiraceae bacterium]